MSAAGKDWNVVILSIPVFTNNSPMHSPATEYQQSPFVMMLPCPIGRFFSHSINAKYGVFLKFLTYSSIFNECGKIFILYLFRATFQILRTTIVSLLNFLFSKLSKLNSSAVSYRIFFPGV